MTTPSKLSQSGLSIGVYEPLIIGREQVGNYSSEISSYTHTISSNGGYVSASFKVSGNLMFLEGWLQSGLGRHVVVHGPSMQVVWEGFVNDLTVNMGVATFTRGPLIDVANRVTVTYTELIEFPDGTVEPVTGVTAETVITEDEESQEKYGIWEKVVNVGEAFPADAVYIRDLYLEENRRPGGSPTINISGGAGDISVTVNCRGYIEWLTYVYNDELENQYVYCSELIKTILGDDPNDIISTTYDKIEENLVLHATYTNENKLARSLIDDILNLGGGSDDRWTFGIYKDRKAIYAPIPTEIEYIFHKTEKTQEIEDYNGFLVKPWDVLPCKWVFIPDFLTSFIARPEDMRYDPRVFFAEEVSFTAPDQVSISGAKVRKLDQYLAKLGLRGS